MTDVAQGDSPRRFAVTGAAGFIGSHLTAALGAKGHRVVALDNLQAGRWSAAHDDARQVTCDLVEQSRDELADLLRGADVLFHLAAEKYNSSKAVPQRILDVNVLATHRLFEAAALAGTRVVFTSSLYAYGRMRAPAMVETDVPEPQTYYGLSKVAGEHMLRALGATEGLRWSVARLFFIYGPNQHAGSGYRSVIVKNFERLRDGKPPVIYGSGEQALDYVYVADAVDALTRLAGDEAEGEVFNVASGRGTTVNELTQGMLAVAHSVLEAVHAEPDWTEGSARVGDPGKIARKLGWQASTPMREGLERMAGEFLDR